MEAGKMEGMKGCDRVCYPLGCGQHESWAVYYVLDGKRCETYDAVDYMNEQGFTTGNRCSATSQREKERKV
jgi:hypothetical protein